MFRFLVGQFHLLAVAVHFSPRFIFTVPEKLFDKCRFQFNPCSISDRFYCVRLHFSVWMWGFPSFFTSVHWMRETQKIESKYCPYTWNAPLFSLVDERCGKVTCFHGNKPVDLPLLSCLLFQCRSSRIAASLLSVQGVVTRVSQTSLFLLSDSSTN
jgi:hypothetical protein